MIAAHVRAIDMICEDHDGDDRQRFDGPAKGRAMLDARVSPHQPGELPFDRMIATFPYHQINEAIAAQHLGDCIKVVLLMAA